MSKLPKGFHMKMQGKCESLANLDARLHVQDRKGWICGNQ